MRNPVLRFPAGTPNVDPTTYGRSPALMDPDQTQTSNGALNQPPISGGNARGSSRVPQIQPNLIDMRSEGLMRIGGAISGASQNGGLAAMQAGSEAYGGIMDYNRRQEDEAFALEEARRQALQTRMTNAAKNATPPQTDEQAFEVNNGIQELSDMIGMLEEGGMTGPYDGTVQAWLDEKGVTDAVFGGAEGAKRAYYRQLLEGYRVNEALEFVSKTKGAISEKEMKLFLSPLPVTQGTTEETWLMHLREKKRIALKLKAFMDLQNGGPSAPDTTGYSVVNG